MNKNTRIDSKLLEETLTTLHCRIEERFPKSGLGKVCEDIIKILNKTNEQKLCLVTTRVIKINQPNNDPYFRPGSTQVLRMLVLKVLAGHS